MFTPMMTTPLTITSLMHHAERVNGRIEVVSVTADNPRHRYTYRDAFKRARQLANALKKLGIKPGETVGTVAWNDYRHLEIYYAVSCSGMICHTLNPRLFPEQLEYIINHGEDKWICVDPTLLPLLEPLRDKMPAVKGFIVMTDEAHMPETRLDNVLCYETLLAAESDQFDWPELDENTPSALCYTSGTTGNPKGVLYTHRSTLLHCYASICADVFGLSVKDVALPIVPMFHVNGWGMVYSAPMVGTKLVMPGPKMGDGETLCTLINEERVTVSAGVPTVWLALLNYLNQSGKKVESLQRITSGGAACPFVVYDEMRRNYDVEVQIGWGMTEMNPLGTYNGHCPPALESSLSKEELDQQKLKAGRPVFGVDIKITDEDGNELPWDSKSSGAIKVRGPWIINEYLHYDKPTLGEDGWFETGDVGCIDEWGYLQITDRLKDVIKSGGEWISSVELENLAMGMDELADAAVIAARHAKWDERPLLIAVKAEGQNPSEQDILAGFEGKVASWQIPDAVVFVEQLPRNATGKVLKNKLRDEFGDTLLNQG